MERLRTVKEITTSEEKSRTTITKYRAQYRELYQKFESGIKEYGKFAKTIFSKWQIY